jgi:methyl-accepting chemotaxis protein
MTTTASAGTPLLSFFRNLRVLNKLAVLVSVVCALLLAVGVLGVAQLGSANTRLDAMYRDSLQAIVWLDRVSADVQATRYEINDLAVDPNAVTEDIANLGKLADDIAQNWSEYTATDMRGRETGRDAFNAAWNGFRQLRDDQLLPLIKQGRVAEFQALRDAKALPAFQRMQAALKGLSDIEDRVARESIAAAHSAYSAARMLIFGLVAVAIVAACALAVVIGRTISKPLGRTLQVLEGLAGGRLDERVGITGRDEVGRMAAALDVALGQIAGVLRDVHGNVASLTTSAQDLRSVSNQMNSSAQNSAEQAGSASTAADLVTQNITTIASGSEELGASIAEIARSTAGAAEVASRAVDASEGANQILGKLGDSSSQIAAVVKLITSIAEQTNLLALNATIEAARAGDAGKGFAVVAGEVKELAQQTAKATEDITQRVGAIQADSAEAGTAIAEIAEIIQQINSAQATIAAAVEEQTATTSEMSRNITEVANSSQHIAGSVTGVAQTATETTAAAEQTAKAATDLSHIAGALRQSLATFRY